MKWHYALLFLLSGTISLAMEQIPEQHYNQLFHKYKQKIEAKNKQREQEHRYGQSDYHKLKKAYQQELAQSLPDCFQEEETYTYETIKRLYQNLEETLKVGPVRSAHPHTSYDDTKIAQKALHRLATSNYGRLFMPSELYKAQALYQIILDNTVYKLRPSLITAWYMPSNLKDYLNTWVSSEKTSDTFIEHYNKFLLVTAYTKELLNVYTQPGMISSPYYPGICKSALEHLPESLQLHPDEVRTFKVSEEAVMHGDTGVIVLRYKQN